MKFTKIAAVASVAAMVAGGAFAGSAEETILTNALNDIKDAYAGVGGTASEAVEDSLKDLIYYVDNHGAVSSISYTGASVDENGDFSDGTLNVSTHDYSSDILASKADVISGIKSEVFGTDVDGNALTATNLVIGEAADVWSVSAAAADNTSGLAHSFVDGTVVAALNTLEGKIADAATAAYDMASIEAINTAATNVETQGGIVDSAVSQVEIAAGATTDMVETTEWRTVSEGEITIEGNVYRSHVTAASHDSIVDAVALN